MSTAFQNREFRLYWLALVISSCGTWIQIVAQALLVLQLSHGRAVSLGYVALAQAAAFFLFALPGGSFADRMDRRKLLLLTQSILMCVALGIGLLVALHVVQVWMIVVASFVSGSVLSFDQPARNAFLPSLVAEKDLMSAISLQSTAFSGAAALAPLLAGFTIQRVGLAASFFLNAGSYVAVIVALAVLRHTSRPLVRSRGSIREAFDVVRRDSLLLWVVSGYALILFASPSMQLLLPVLVPDAMVLGNLFAAFGAGAVGGAILIGRMSVATSKLYLVCCSVVVLSMATIALTRQMGVLLSAILFAGASQSAVSVLTVNLLQSRVAKEMRGRAMSLQTLLIMGVRPLGDFPISVLMTAAGAPAAAGLSALIIGAYSLYLTGKMGTSK